MKILIIHGYLLRGTGSNIFVQSISSELVKLGHNVILMCQDRDVFDLKFISSHLDFDKNNNSIIKKWERENINPCVLYTPNLEGVLPVYIVDKYPGFRNVKTFNDLSQEELDRHIEQNIAAASVIIEKENPNIVLTNHAIISPEIARRLKEKFQIPYYCFLHGSAFNFCVKKDKRLEEIAGKSLSNAEKIFVSSQYLASEIKGFFNTKGYKIKDRLTLIPCGVDTNHFTPNAHPKVLLEHFSKTGRHIYGKSSKLKEESNGELIQKIKQAKIEEFERLLCTSSEKYNHRSPDSDICETIEKISPKRNYIAFVGKFLLTKGPQLIVTILPNLFSKHPDLDVVFVGFGEEREPLELFIQGLGKGDLELIKKIISLWKKKEVSGVSLGIKIVEDFFDNLEKTRKIEEYIKNANECGLSERVHFTGPLIHEELSHLWPLFNITIIPSVFPEAFGMVAIEALASGSLPLMNKHSGLDEIDEVIRNQIPWYGENIIPLKQDNRYLDILEQNISRALVWIKENPESKNILHSIAHNKFSWGKVAKMLLDALL